MFIVYSDEKNIRVATNLATTLGAPVVQSYEDIPPDCSIINWGSCDTNIDNERVINRPQSVANVQDKWYVFSHLRRYDVNTVEFTKDKAVAHGWIVEGDTVVPVSDGQSFAIDRSDMLSIFNADLYTKYIPNQAIFRFHISRSYGILSRETKRSVDGDHHKIKREGLGYVYDASRNYTIPDNERRKLERSINKIPRLFKLDFVAVDVLWNKFREEAYVLDINPTPPLAGSTMDTYCSVFNEMFPEDRTIIDTPHSAAWGGKQAIKHHVDGFVRPKVRL